MTYFGSDRSVVTGRYAAIFIIELLGVTHADFQNKETYFWRPRFSRACDLAHVPSRDHVDPPRQQQQRPRQNESTLSYFSCSVPTRLDIK